MPSRRLYGHQWCWDSAMHLLGWARLQPVNAWRELRSLLTAQHPDGLVGHITFRPEEQGYFPGAEWWQAAPTAIGHRLGSRITQPPLAAICLELADPALRSARIGYQPGLDLRALGDWHEMLCDDRGLGGEPLVVHPWESGRDNAADWEPAFARVPETGTRFDRLDLDAVRAHERPRSADYRRFVALIEQFRALHYDQLKMVDASAFRAHDPVFTLITLQACRSLARLARGHGDERLAAAQDALATELGERVGERAARTGGWLEVELPDAPTAVPRLSCARVANVWREDLSEAQIDELAALVLDGPLASRWGVRSLGLGEPGYEPARYWRGSVWPHLTWWFAAGFAARGRDDVHDALRERTRACLGELGMREYFHPDEAIGLGAEEQGWTAAVALWWLL